MSATNDYTPELMEEQGHGYAYAKCLVQLRRCGTCSTLMFDSMMARGYSFPPYYRQNIEGQVRRAGWHFQSKVTDKENNPICTVCEAAGLATIVCALCEQERPSYDRQESFGDPPEHLCRQCYETVPAKVWMEKESLLREVHRCDFE